MTLTELQVNETATINAVRGARPVVRRWLELGFVPGTPVRLLRFAPCGDPLEVLIRGYRVSLRQEDARNITVTPLP